MKPVEANIWRFRWPDRYTNRGNLRNVPVIIMATLC